jgi:hypothetical protein
MDTLAQAIRNIYYLIINPPFVYSKQNLTFKTLNYGKEMVLYYQMDKWIH